MKLFKKIYLRVFYSGLNGATIGHNNEFIKVGQEQLKQLGFKIEEGDELLLEYRLTKAKPRKISRKRVREICEKVDQQFKLNENS